MFWVPKDLRNKSMARLGNRTTRTREFNCIGSNPPQKISLNRKGAVIPGLPRVTLNRWLPASCAWAYFRMGYTRCLHTFGACHVGAKFTIRSGPEMAPQASDWADFEAGTEAIVEGIQPPSRFEEIQPPSKFEGIQPPSKFEGTQPPSKCEGIQRLIYEESESGVGFARLRPREGPIGASWGLNLWSPVHTTCRTPPSDDPKHAHKPSRPEKRGKKRLIRRQICNSALARPRLLYG